MVTGHNKHLHIVMNDPLVYPKKDGPTVLLLNFCSFDGTGVHDSTCILNVGDHPFIGHATYVAYEHACLKLVEPLVAGVNDHRISLGEPVSEELYERVLGGLKKSSRVAQGVSAFVRFANM